jgi:hypothetical protein
MLTMVGKTVESDCDESAEKKEESAGPTHPRPQ